LEGEILVKRILRLLPISLLCVWFASPLCRAQATGQNVSKAGTTAAVFLEIPVGARAIGMGGAFVGTASDVTTLYWNAAGLARLRRNEVIFTHSEWIADTKYDYAALAIPLGAFGNLGLSLTSLAMDDMLVRTVERPDGTGERFSAGSVALGVHYARNLSDKFSIGFTAKYISETIWDMQAQAFAVDVGTLFTTEFLNGMRIGAQISNFGTDMKLSGRDTRTFHPIDANKIGSNDRIPQNIELDSWHLPLNFQFGLAVDAIKSEENVLTIEADALHPADNYESMNVGVEYGFMQTLFIRSGYQSLFLTDSEGGLSLGAGVLANLFGGEITGRFDYAYTDFGRLKAVHVFALSVLF
jgi:hypothetical protein